MKKTAAKILTFLVSAAVVLSLGWGGYSILNRNFLYLDGELFPRNGENIDLSGKEIGDLALLREFPRMRRLNVRDTGLTVGDYEWLRREFPDCEILWDVPFQGNYYRQDTETIRLTALSDGDMEMLDYLPDLTEIDAWDCPDLPRLFALQQRRSCRVLYDVPLCGREWPWDTVHMTLQNADAGELMEKLVYLPKLETVFLVGVLPEREALGKLEAAYPQITLSWLVELEGMSLERSAEAIDLRDANVKTADEAAELLSFFSGMKQVDMTGCGFSDEEEMALADRFPETDFLFDITVGDLTVSTAAEEIDLSGQELGAADAIEKLLPYFPNLKKVTACGCGIESEAMAALQERYAHIRFVWSVELAGLLLRTDDVYFMPNKYGAKCTDANIYDLRYCVDMVCVDVGHGENVTNCEWAAYMPKLKYLILADSGVHDISPLAGLTELVFLELFQSRVKDYSPLLTCTALEDLNLCYTYGSPEPIAQMTWLKRLWWSGSWEARTLLPEKLPDTLMEFYSLSSTGNGWREGQHYYDMRDIVGMGYMTG